MNEIHLTDAEIDEQLRYVYDLLAAAQEEGLLDESAAWQAIREAYLRGYSDAHQAKGER